MYKKDHDPNMGICIYTMATERRFTTYSENNKISLKKIFISLFWSVILRITVVIRL